MKAFTTAISVCILLASAARSESPEQHLKQQLKGKTVLIRGFFQDDRLEYTAQGEPMGTPQPGSWTVAKMEVHNISVRADRLEIRGPRVITFVDPYERRFTNKVSHEGGIKVTIDASPSSLDPQQLDSLIQKIFVIDSKPSIAVFPSYWREFLSDNIIRTKDKHGKVAFRRRQETDVGGEDRPVYTDSNGEPVFRVLKTVEGPKIISQVNPEFTQCARDEKFTGTNVVSLEVDKTGAVRDVQIVQPIGCGLDDAAVRAVRQWRFAPAKRNGEPVAVLVEVEMSYSVYNGPKW
jgi:TonB family protein